MDRLPVIGVVLVLIAMVVGYLVYNPVSIEPKKTERVASVPISVERVKEIVYGVKAEYEISDESAEIIQNFQEKLETKVYEDIFKDGKPHQSIDVLIVINEHLCRMYRKGSQSYLVDLGIKQ